MKKEILDMLKLQDQLNTKINPNWRKDRDHVDFARATWLECAELVESLPWKWWKKQTPDIENVQIEVVDIWHFIMSFILLDFENLEDALESEYLNFFIKGVNEDFHNVNINGVYIHHYLGETDEYQRIIFLAERVAEGFLKDEPLEGIFFFGLLVRNTISFKDLYLLYIGKNILNHIRQEFGYKEGNYKKTIDGLEDNKYLFKLVKQVKNKNQLEEKIREEFKKLMEG
ncbi:MAG: dUTPase [Hydrogenothermus sp.]|nr:MAG: dUTPase [Hydrogenothermus sp.]